MIEGNLSTIVYKDNIRWYFNRIFGRVDWNDQEWRFNNKCMKEIKIIGYNVTLCDDLFFMFKKFMYLLNHS